MNEPKECLADGVYSFNEGGELEIIDGKAKVTINNTFGLRIGTTIPLSRPDGNMEITTTPTPEGDVVLNGHAII